MHDSAKSKVLRWGLAAALAMALVPLLSTSLWTPGELPAAKVPSAERPEPFLASADNAKPDSSVQTRQLQGVPKADHASLDWLKQLVIDDAGADSRLFVIDQLRMIASPASVEVLAQMLGDPNPIVREQTILALGEKGSVAVPMLGQAMISDPDAALRQQAIDLLAGIEGPASTAMLRYASMHDPLQHIRDQAEAMLGERPAPMSIEPVMQDKNWEFYTDQFQALWYLPEDKAIQSLRDVYDEANGEDIRRQALTELANLGSDRSIEPLSRGLSDRSQEIRAETLYLLADHAGDTLHLLGQALIGDRDPFVRAEALELIAEFGTPAADALLLLGINDDDEDLRARARELVGER